MNDLKGIIEDCNKSDLVSKKVIEKVIKIIGQKRWNRIHDEESDICTTMGELIITLKGIPDLEKEKCELLGIIQGKDKVIKELEEESDFFHIEKGKYKSDFLQEAKNNIKLNRQLIKAKEIIRDFLSVAIDYIDKEDKNYSFIAEAEQFLKED